MARADAGASLTCVEARPMALDGPAFETAYRAHAARLRAVAFDVLRNRDAAEDAVHGALMRVWSTGGYRPERGALLPYLIACVRREALDAIRGAKRRHLREVRAGADVPSAVDEIAALDPLEARRVARALERISAVQRDVIVRAYYGHRTLAEVAQDTNLPLGTVKSRLAAALRSLHSELTEGSPMNHLDDDAELYALGLTERERSAEIEAHIADCAGCRARVVAAEAAAASLAATLPADARPPRRAARGGPGSPPPPRWSSPPPPPCEGFVANGSRADLARTDLALNAIASSHFGHTTLTSHPGVVAKAHLLARRRWCYVIANGAPRGAHV